MQQGAQTFIKFLREKTTKSKVTMSSNNLIAPLAGLDSQFETRTSNYRALPEDVFHVIKLWPPTYIPYNSPFNGCLILGPAAIHLRVAIDRAKAKNDAKSSAGPEVEMLKLALGHTGRFWKFGSILLELAESVAVSET
ncbi:hypothetical protein LTR93_011936 [Exophiala xenobiotica]|nr:hypothetical protein LTR93_011936 [Exophiala xenobiotica]